MAVIVGRTALAKIDLVLAQGANNPFAFIYYTDDTKTSTVDLSGYTARAQVRRHVGGDVYLDLTPMITLGGTDGRIDVVVPAAVTEALEIASPFSGVWDLELVDATAVPVRFAEGKVTIDPDVTRMVVS